MKLHPRTQIVQQADHELATFMLELEKKHDLTPSETTKLLAERIANLMKYCIRSERHPDDPNKRGDEA